MGLATKNGKAKRGKVRGDWRMSPNVWTGENQKTYRVKTIRFHIQTTAPSLYPTMSQNAAIHLYRPSQRDQHRSFATEIISMCHYLVRSLLPLYRICLTFTALQVTSWVRPVFAGWQDGVKTSWILNWLPLHLYQISGFGHIVACQPTLSVLSSALTCFSCGTRWKGTRSHAKCSN